MGCWFEPIQGHVSSLISPHCPLHNNVQRGGLKQHNFILFLYCLGSHIRPLFGPINKKVVPKVCLGQSGEGSNIDQNHSYTFWETISAYYMAS